MISGLAQKQIDNIKEKCDIICPILVIRCITYNHNPYLKDALNGFVMQKTNFPFIAIVHDDASTDGTTEILKEYAEKYPDIIFPIFEEENQYSKKDGSLRKIMDKATLCTDPKYIAFCEGDDYWTDPYKLQNQVDFLETHPDYSLCFHNALVVYEDKKTESHPFFKIEDREYQIEEAVENWLIPTASMVFRSNVYKSEIYNKFVSSSKFVVGDNPLIRCCGLLGKMYGYSNLSSVYRKQETGWTNNLNRNQMLSLIIQEKEYVKVFGDRFKLYSKKFAGMHSRAFWSLMNHKQFNEAFKLIFTALIFAPKETLLSNISFLKKSISK